MQYVCLNNEIRMPVLGYGVGQLDAETRERCVLDAISVWYRSINTAQIYGNKAQVGMALAKCGVPRSELFLTIKVWISGAGYETVRASIFYPERLIDLCQFAEIPPMVNQVQTHDSSSRNPQSTIC